MSPLQGVGGRLALALLTVVAGVLAVVYLIVVPSYQSSLEQSELRSLAAALRRVVVPKFQTTSSNLLQPFVLEMQPRVNARVVVFQVLSPPNGPLEPQADSSLDQSSAALERDSVADAASRHATLARGIVTRDGQHYAEVAYPVQSWVVLLAAPLHDQLQTVALVRRRVFIAGAIATAFALLVGYAGASLFARRLRRLEAAAERIAAGYFDEPVIDHGQDEVGQLARTFERMRLRIASLDRARGAFIANASHELRTPIFSLGGFLELLDEPDLDADTRDEFLAQMREQVARLGKLATDLLDLSRLDAGWMRVASETIDLTALAGELAGEFGPRAAAESHVLEVEADAPAEARGDAARVLQIGRVLVENALIHTPPGTTVRLGTAVEGGRAALTVGNDGPAIPPDAQSQIFERFFRLDGGRASGSGLGLAIARELAEVMDGRLELTSSPAGTRFTLVLHAEQVEPAKTVKTAQTVS
jgi:signal transduction histidine kinase